MSFSGFDTILILRIGSESRLGGTGMFWFVG